MKISASYWIFEGGLEGELSISDAMEKTRKLGFDGIELGIASKGVLTHKTTKEECEEIRDLALKNRLHLPWTSNVTSWDCIRIKLM